VTSEPGLTKISEMETTLWQPTIRYEYAVNKQTYIGHNYDLLDTRYTQRDKALALKDRYQLGESYACWYDPLDPGTAVLLSGNPLTYWLLLLPVAFLAIGIGGLGYTFWQFSASRERRAAITQRATGKELFEETSETRKFPAIPGDAEVTNSPGTTLAFRLPIATRVGWQLFASAAGCLCWNGLVALFVLLAVRKTVSGNADWVLFAVLAPFVVAGLWLFVHLCRQFWRTSGIGPTRIEISEHPLQPGGTYDLFVAQTGKMILEQLEVTLRSEEEATFRQGTDTITDTQAVACVPVLFCNDITIGPGEPFEEHCRLRIPLTGMHSFQSSNNSISWKLSVHARVARRPDYQRDFSIIVVPAAAMGGGPE
jgi:hypothetical protein